MIKQKKLFEKFSECVDNCSYTSNFADENTNICIDIANKHAVDFAYWITNPKNKDVKGCVTIEELLEIYKDIKTFKCDGCGEEIDNREKFPMFDENHNIQEGLFECLECKGL